MEQSPVIEAVERSWPEPERQWQSWKVEAFGGTMEIMSTAQMSDT